MSKSWATHDFYCINCGAKGIPLIRKQSSRKSANHRKNMYCIRCKHTVNHIECRSAEEVKQFLSDFNTGKYTEEAKADLLYEANNPQLRVFL